MKIEGSNAFVTGGASGLGEATARALVARGARVAIYDLPRSKGAELEKELGPAARFLAGDVADEAQVNDALDGQPLGGEGVALADRLAALLDS